MILRVKRLPHFCGILPQYKTIGASGADVHASLREDVVLSPGERTLVPTGLVFEIPDGFEIQVRPRSGLALKNGIMVVNSPGTIDSDYRGELQIILANLGSEKFKIKNGDRIAQLVFSPVFRCEYTPAVELSETERGVGGFGSTGLNT